VARVFKNAGTNDGWGGQKDPATGLPDDGSSAIMTCL
jgi:hypothetical protein